MTTPGVTAKHQKPESGSAYRIRRNGIPTTWPALTISRQRLPLQATPHGAAAPERDRIIVSGEHYLAVKPTRYLAGSRYPALLVAFGHGPSDLREQQRLHRRGAGQAAGLRAGDSLRTHRVPRRGAVSGKTTKGCKSRNTGGSTKPKRGVITAPDWAATYWWTENPCPPPSGRSRTERCRDTTRCWTCTCAGSGANWRE